MPAADRTSLGLGPTDASQERRRASWNRLDPSFLANEQAYLQMRDSLLAQYRGQWVAVDGGKVVAAGPRLLDVMEEAAKFGKHSYIALVGAEDAVVFKMRRASFAYDQRQSLLAGPNCLA
jgi:hypothetical protein